MSAYIFTIDFRGERLDITGIGYDERLALRDAFHRLRGTERACVAIAAWNASDKSARIIEAREILRSVQ